MRLSRRDIIKGALAIGASGAATITLPGTLGRTYQILEQLDQPSDLLGTRIWASLSPGSGPGQAGVLSLSGIRPDGAKAIVARANGDLALLDTLNSRVIILRRGSVRATVDLERGYPTDLVESQGRLWILDAARSQVMEIDGTFVRGHALARESRDRASRLAAHPLGVAVVEQDEMSYPLSLGRRAIAEGLPEASGLLTHVDYPRRDLARKFAKLIPAAGPSSTIATQNWLGSAVPLGTDRIGRSYYQVAQLVRGGGGTVAVALSLHRFASDGTPAGVAKVPVRGRASQPVRPVTFTPEGEAFALFPESGRTLIVQLTWSQTLVAAQPARRLPAAQDIAMAATPIPVSRATAQSRAYGYWDHAWYCSSNNYRDDGCRVKPAFINLNTTEYEIPYDWGGWDTLAGFDSQISAGVRAGNAQGAYGSCSSAGVDCSGFVGQAWGVSDSQRYSDWQLVDNFVTNKADMVPDNPPPWMQPGDAYDLRYSHIMMHDAYSPWGNGVQVYEAALSNLGRVWHPFYSWASLDSYYWCIGYFTS